MTIRGVILGLLGATIVCGFTHFNDTVIHQTCFVGSTIPPVVFGTLLIAVVGINPLLARIAPRLKLTGAELAVALTLTLASCAIPSSGLMETFTNATMLPHRYARVEPGWKAEGVVDMAPSYMLADPSANEGKALDGYIQGLPQGQDHIGLSDIPWRAWTGPLAFWLPLVFVFWIALVGLALVVHRQWSQHERLPYPIATFAGTLLPREGEQPVFRNNVFWLGLGVVCGIHLINHIQSWVPGSVSIPRHFDFGALGSILPSIARGGGWKLLHPTIYFAVVGLAFLLPRDLSFSMGIGPVLFCYLAGVLGGYGIAMDGGAWFEVDLKRALQVGAYTGMFVMILYTGRRYYWGVVRRAVGLPSADAVAPGAVWGARAFAGGLFVMFVAMVAVGIDVLLAAAFLLLAVIFYLVVARISAETGYIWIMPWWEPAGVIIGVLGTRAVGPSVALLMFLFSTVFLINGRDSLSILMVNGLRILDGRKVSPSRVSLVSVGALVLGLAIAVPATLYVTYDNGVNQGHIWASVLVPRWPFDQTVKMQQRLRTQGALEEVEATSGFSRLLAARPSGTLAVGFTIALAVFLLVSFARLRLPRWPLHPAMFLIWGTYAGPKFAASFLVGFAVKWAVVRYGGDRLYRRAMPFMIGLVAGDMLTGVVTSAIGAAYYFITGTPPPHFVVLVG